MLLKLPLSVVHQIELKMDNSPINNQTYQLDLNNGPNNLHGGAECLTYADFNVTQMPAGYALTTTLPHQENGFPGNVNIKVCYTLEDNNFIVSYEATTDQRYDR